MIVLRSPEGHLLGVYDDPPAGQSAASIFGTLYRVQPDTDSGGFRLVPL